MCCSWPGIRRLIYGTLPSWLVTASMAAMILSIIPVVTVGLNHHMTMRNYFPLMRYSPTLRFTVFGAMSYTAFSLLGVVISLRSLARYSQFSEVGVASTQIGLYALLRMMLFGAMCSFVARSVGPFSPFGALLPHPSGAS